MTNGFGIRNDGQGWRACNSDPFSDENEAGLRDYETFSESPPTTPNVPAPLTPAEVLEAANAQRDSLLSTAALRIAPLQDAVDLGSATDADTANLKLWKQYRVLVNRVSDQSGFPATIDWPLVPA